MSTRINNSDFEETLILDLERENTFKSRCTAIFKGVQQKLDKLTFMKVPL